MTRTVVVGAGIAGLAFAERLMRLEPGGEIRVIEAAPRPGGWIRTQRSAGFVQECGAETIVDDGTGLSGLLDDLGLAAIEPLPGAARLHVARSGRLLRLPTSLRALRRSPLLPIPARLALGLERFRKRGRNPAESFAAFVERRFSKTVLERIAEPIAAGIFGGSPEHMETASAFPRLWAAEQQHGSVLRGMRAERVVGRRLLGFAGGNEDLVSALRHVLGDRLWTGREVTELRVRDANDFAVTLGGEQPTELQAERIALAIPAWRAARLLAPETPELARELAGIAFHSVASVHLGFQRADVPDTVQGLGFVLPRSEPGARAYAVLYSSSLFPGRSHGGRALFRVLLGGRRHPEILAQNDDGLRDEAEQTLRRYTGIQGKLWFSRVRRYERALPLYEPGHAARLARIETLLKRTPGLDLLGSSYRASGVANCIREARARAEHVALLPP